jgi:hypothetical protein
MRLQKTRRKFVSRLEKLLNKTLVSHETSRWPHLRICWWQNTTGSNKMEARAYVCSLPALYCEFLTSSPETGDINHCCTEFRNDWVMTPPLGLVEVVFLATCRSSSALWQCYYKPSLVSFPTFEMCICLG